MAESEKLWDFTSLETAMDDFWRSFFVKERELRSFAVAQTSNFSQSFVDAFITGLDRVRWRESNDPDYVIARKIMRRVALLNSDPAEYVCSIFGLVKKSKRIVDNERKKEKKKSQTITEAIWDQDAMESAMTKFWDAFFLGKLDLSSFAQTRSADFPESLITKFIQRLDELRWSVSKDPEYKVASAVMKRLVSPTPELEGDLEAKFLAERMKEERAEEAERAQRKQSEREERRKREEAESKEKRERKKTQAAFNKREKERKKQATKLNQQRRVGGRAIGL